MSSNYKPLISLGGDSEAPVINYNVPEPTSYSGKNVIEFAIPESYFTNAAFIIPEIEDDSENPTGSRPFDGIFQELKDVLNIDVGVIVVESPPTSDQPPNGPDRPEIEPEILSVKPIGSALKVPNRSSGSSRRLGGTRRRINNTAEIVDHSKLQMSVTMKNSSVAWYPMDDGTFDVVSSRSLSQQAQAITPKEFLEYAENGFKPVLQKNLYGTFDWKFIPIPTSEKAEPKILLVESYRLSSFLGAYGAGRTLKTFSLLPGEKTIMSVTTFRNTNESYKSSSSILDSVTEESSLEFEETLASEQSDKETSAKSTEYHADAEVNANWGWGSASVSGGTSSESSSTREEFAKNVSSATEKSAMSASAKRDVQVETSFEVSTQTGEETSITREIENINAGRTLNFVFRQMNQEFITLLHLTDVRIGFFNGFNETKSEATLPKMADFLATYIKPEFIDEVAEMLKFQLANIFDYEGNHHSFIEDKVLVDPTGKVVAEYLRAKVENTMTYENLATGTEIKVQGIITRATTSVLRTEGVIVESLIGVAPALDEYSTVLQNEKVKEKSIQNAALELENARISQALHIITNNDAERARLYQDIFVPPVEKSTEV